MSGSELPMSAGPGHRPHPSKFANVDGLSLRMQVFVIVRDADDRICCVREKMDSLVWKLPGETLMPEETVDGCASRVSKLWFGEDLEPEIKQVITWPDQGDGKKYIVFIYESRVDSVDDLTVPEDTEEFTFVEAGKAPGPWGMSHGDVFAELS